MHLLQQIEGNLIYPHVVGGSVGPVSYTHLSFDDMRQGFLSGSDDYMVKPVNVNEMVLRVGALLRRAQIPVSYTHLNLILVASAKSP